MADSASLKLVKFVNLKTALLHDLRRNIEAGWRSWNYICLSSVRMDLLVLATAVLGRVLALVLDLVLRLGVFMFGVFMDDIVFVFVVPLGSMFMLGVFMNGVLHLLRMLSSFWVLVGLESLLAVTVLAVLAVVSDRFVITSAILIVVVLVFTAALVVSMLVGLAHVMSVSVLVLGR